MATHSCDFLVIGSGIAGLSFALKAAEHGSVIIISKANLDETNTVYAQGGIAAVTYDPDSAEKHINDTLICGDGLCNEQVVRMIVEEAPTQIKQLIQWGVRFDRNESGQYDLAKEGGHSEHRILHHKDNTGHEIQRALTCKVKNHKNIEIFENYFAVEIITQHHLGMKVKRGSPDISCFGAFVLNLKTQKVEKFTSKTTIMATGGIGNIYHTTTNPLVATGDGIAMVYRAKGEIENMEFIQFHPSSLFNPGERPSFLITEAMRGFGAILKTTDGKEFMYKYDKRGSLAPRDIVARAIDNEMKIRGDDFVYLDATFKDAADIKNHFPNIYQKCLTIGIDITKDMIPVVPAAHYLCGGIKVDMNGESTIKHLYAIGECSSTGLHGANRLASNSLIEALVYAETSFQSANKALYEIEVNHSIPDWDYEGTTHPEEMVLVTQSYKEMQQIMSNYVGIVRSNLRLERALIRLETLYRETEELYKKSILTQNLCELRNMINVGYLIIKNAQKMRESRGLHYSLDYPKVKGTEF
ncbi:MAG: L-aspartate oxidase [Bacteroidales bacterium]|jgi:L-aspartate oxidase|nr:L-aspartate oxidase [Bacteroidales bacterium]MDD4384160.1 L-aspartate oxidase [Bacteroidales bacterium]MDY0197786.1 L-aspartate oxidase [Tenuifilaceae bacterium]